MNVGDLVIVPAEPALGVARIERLIESSGEPCARLLLYVDGSFVVRKLSEIAACPPNTRVA